MKRLSKMFLAVLLLTAASVSWAACPEGTKNNYKGECVPIAAGVSLYFLNMKCSEDGMMNVNFIPEE